ncbi:hypothetical protein Trydic_g5121 [Trypoxylus dichotomus]
MDHFKTVRKPTMPVYQPSKEELAKLYQTAVGKGDTVKIQTPENGLHSEAAVYEIDEHPKHESNEEDTSAYYFYYYPLKSFLDELTWSTKPPSGPGDIHDVDSSDTFTHHEVATMKPQHQYHTHTHQHNIHILDPKPPEPTKKPHKLEPLFMAISGFIGMTIMFVLSALILPKFSVLKPRGVKDNSEMTSMINVIFKAIEGYDCSERFACEFGKTARAFNIHNNRFVKLIRRIGPYSLSKKLYDINKYSNKKYKCAVIQCKMKEKGQTLQPKRTKQGKS